MRKLQEVQTPAAALAECDHNHNGGTMDAARQGEARQIARSMVYGGDTARNAAVSAYLTMDSAQRSAVAQEMAAAASWRAFGRRRREVAR